MIYKHDYLNVRLYAFVHARVYACANKCQCVVCVKEFMLVNVCVHMSVCVTETYPHFQPRSSVLLRIDRQLNGKKTNRLSLRHIITIHEMI